MKRCSCCNNEINDDATVCSYCGFPQKPGIQSQFTEDTENEIQVDNSKELNNQDDNSKKNKKRLIIAIIVSIIIIVAFVFFLIFLFSLEDEKKENMQNVDAVTTNNE